MARKDALFRIQKVLHNRLSELYRRVGRDIADLGHEASGDSADVAFDNSRDELASQLAEVEIRELQQIERALNRLRQGTYGHCESCSSKITVVRLNALPYTTLCIGCQREYEESGRGWASPGAGLDWARVSDSDGMDEREVNLSDLEMDLSK